MIRLFASSPAKRPVSLAFGAMALFCAAHSTVAASTHESLNGGPSAAQAPDIFKSALQLYRYDRTQPLDVVITKQKRYPECLMLRIVYMSANREHVPAVVFEPFRASRWPPVPAVVLLHGLGGSKEDLVPFGHFLAATGYAALILVEYGHGQRMSEGQGRSAAD